jgi:hypothetical protein
MIKNQMVPLSFIETYFAAQMQQNVSQASSSENHIIHSSIENLDSEIGKFRGIAKSNDAAEIVKSA